MRLVRRAAGVLSVLAACHFVEAAEPAGYVLEVHGRWTTEGTPVTVGLGLPPGARLTVAAAQPGDRVVVVDARTAAVLATRQCEPARVCSPLVLPRGKEAAAPLDELLGRLLARIGGDPDRYVATLSRGPMALHSAVLPVADGAADLAPLLGRLHEGAEVRLRALHCGTAGACPEGPLERRVDSDGAARLHGVSPGLYELTLRQPPGAAGPERLRGWLLFTTTNDHGQVRREFDALARRLEGWRGVVDPGIREAVLRAWLEQKAGL